MDRIGVALQRLEALTCAYVPEMHRLVSTATGEDFPVWTESDRSDLIGMSLQGLEALTCAYVPETYLLVSTASGEDGFAVGTESY